LTKVVMSTPCTRSDRNCGDATSGDGAAACNGADATSSDGAAASNNGADATSGDGAAASNGADATSGDGAEWGWCRGADTTSGDGVEDGDSTFDNSDGNFGNAVARVVDASNTFFVSASTIVDLYAWNLV
jgi:hypothetical protein